MDVMQLQNDATGWADEFGGISQKAESWADQFAEQIVPNEEVWLLPCFTLQEHGLQAPVQDGRFRIVI